MYKHLFLFLFTFPSYTIAQSGIGSWGDYLPYSETKKIAVGKNSVFAATQHSVFSYSLIDNSITRMSKINYLSDIQVGDIAFSNTTNDLIVAYKTGAIDFVNDNGTVSLFDLKRSKQVANKTINHIYLTDSTAFLSCGFGILKLNLLNREIQESYFIGESSNPIEVFETTIKSDSIFAATNIGIFVSHLQNSLIKFPNGWKKINGIKGQNDPIKKIVTFNNSLLYVLDSEIFNNDSVYQIVGNKSILIPQISGKTILGMEVTPQNKLGMAFFDNAEILNENFEIVTNYYTYLSQNSEKKPRPAFITTDVNNNAWIADTENGMIYLTNPFNATIINPSSPKTIDAHHIQSINNKIYVARGTRNSSWNKTYTPSEVFMYDKGNWETLNKDNQPVLENTSDILYLTNDKKNLNKWYASSYGYGIFEFENDKALTLHNSQNSTLFKIDGLGETVSNLATDNDGNLWVTQNLTTNALTVKDNEGKWQSFNFSKYIGEELVPQLLVTQTNKKWLAVSAKGILVFDDKGTIEDLTDDETKLLTTAEGFGNLPSSTILSMAEDKDGEIWVGTDLGLRVFYNPENVFEETGFDAADILIKQDVYYQILFETEAVTCISIDGGNRKWVGTAGSGVFLMSADGTQQVYHFTEDNSPLWSNNITSIDIIDKTGEVFIGTEKGIISFFSTETEPNQNFENLYVYPNPVKLSQTNQIAITGLVENSDVKIADTAGNIVFKTSSNGGQIVWDGTTTKGQKVMPGVYIVFVASRDGVNKSSTKFLISP